MTPQVQDFIPGSLEDMYKHIEVLDGHHVTAKQKGQVQIKMYDNNRDTFITTLHNVLLAPDICDRLFSIITSINQGQTFLFHKKNCMLYFSDKEKYSVTLPHSAHQKHVFLGEIIQMSKSKKIAPRKKVDLELLHHILGHISTRLLMSEDNVNVWKDIEFRIYPDYFCTSCQISPMSKKTRSKNPLKPKVPFKCFYGYCSRNITKMFNK